MSEGFLTRWSRRKLEAAEPPPQRDAEPARELPDQVPGAADATAPAPPPERKNAPDVDLPSLESIGPGTDIRAFLVPGVPVELSRAALRRAWVSDPAIRDFIGLAENTWDFTAPNTIPGFASSVSPEEVKRFLQAMSGEQRESKNPTSPTDALESASPEQELASRVQENENAGRDSSAAASDSVSPQPAADSGAESNAAVQKTALRDGEQSKPSRRDHGAALPE